MSASRITYYKLDVFQFLSEWFKEQILVPLNNYYTPRIYFWLLYRLSVAHH